MDVTIDLEGLGDDELLRLFGEIPTELKRRRLVRSERKNPTGEIAEALVARALQTDLLPGRDTGHDLVDPATESRIQVKGCRVVDSEARTSAQQFGDIDLLDDDRFDELVGVVFDKHYGVTEAWRMPRAEVQRLARTVRGKARLNIDVVRRAFREEGSAITAFEVPPHAADVRGDDGRAAPRAERTP